MNGRKQKRNYNCDDDYSVVQFNDNGSKLFECIWDGWFVDENRKSCFWPPSKGKSYMLRVLSKETPDDSWKIYECVVISEGHATYKSGFDMVKEKCKQKYNTSSATEEEEALKFRRMHPVLAQKSDSFEHLFTGRKVSEKSKAKMKPRSKNVKVRISKIEEPTGKVSRAKLPSQGSRLPTPTPIASLDPVSHFVDIEDSDKSSNHSVSRSFHKPRSIHRYHASRSPSRSGSGSPSQSGSRSSLRSGSRSPLRCGSRSPLRSGSRTPLRSGSRSPLRSGSLSPTRSGSVSPSRSGSCPPSRSRSRSSQRTNSSRCTKSRSRSPSQTPKNATSGNEIAPQSASSFFRVMQLQLNELRAILKQNQQRLSAMERRQGRMEVSVNKILVSVIDLKQSINTNHMSPEKTAGHTTSNGIPKGLKPPEFPIKDVHPLVVLNRNLKDDQFRKFLLAQESYYCTASRQSNTVVMTAYMKRFISLKLRDRIHFKDPKIKDNEPILARDFPRVYQFLEDVMVSGYAMSKTPLSANDAHVAIRTVWGRTKQMMREQRL